MRSIVSLFALLVVVAAEPEYGSQSARHVAAKVINHGAVGKAITEARRHLDTGSGTIGIDSGDLAQGFCLFMDLFDEEFEKEGLSCDCETDDSAITYACSSNENFEPICDEMGDSGCVEDMDFKVTLPFDGGETSMETCAQFGSEALEGLANKEVCLTMVMDMPNLMKVEMGGDNMAEGDMIPEFLRCSASIGGEPCTCQPCHDGLGIDIKCDNGMNSQCSDFLADKEDEQGMFTPTLAQFSSSDDPGIDTSPASLSPISSGHDFFAVGLALALAATFL
eukprot:CAMPEP_0183323562 /NCGR_PEP_ID=MMETSP0160_2-20130417/74743_1 /TAXON_ID=2839 ORGANISM="Odontella Sinensis, Strain Grunow 1884" /NCGR_SAMPLE_ID=MMETSP0160_2 /ASSEMBLY_ACC=CAM_ASM_000250 /LENGTH=278 /DNA_ID=CAMNT_0025490969 /DNA_START=36 /DNA_END=872 /DNA_ORIENTATION=+